jgi:uncharacterized OB-fold protein
MSTVARYWREIPQRYRLEAGKCSSCGKVWFPPRRVCGHEGCTGREFETVVLPDEGRVVTHTVIHVGPTGFGDLQPYAMGLVELTDGTRIMSQIVDVDPVEVKIDMPVRVEFRLISEEGESGVLKYGYKCVPA